MDATTIIDEVNKLEPTYKTDIVITGGEPLLYWRHSEFQELLEYYITHGYQVTIETNASLDINFEFDYQKEVLFSMSVKLSNSFEPLKKRINENTLKTILNHTQNSYLKFVVSNDFIEQAKEEIKTIAKLIPTAQIYLMPMGDSEKEIREHCQSVITMAIECGYKYCDRLHIRVWDNQRGV